MDLHNTESEFEKLRKENMKKNEEAFKQLFPSNILKSLRNTSPKNDRVKIITKQVENITPRRSLRRSCKREREPSPEEDHFTDEERESGPPPTYIQFGSWRKRLKKMNDKDREDANDPLFFIDDEDDEMNGDRRRKSGSKKRLSKNVSFRPFEAVTEEDLVLVADRTSDKKYDQVEGTSCHQCRQKTDDLKTVCRGSRCVGVRGQFCGPCLKNRYGECAKEAIMNPNWECPPCRGICNCSFCMKKRGRRATGILIHAAKQQGFDNVSTYLGLSVKVMD